MSKELEYISEIELFQDGDNVKDAIFYSGNNSFFCSVLKTIFKMKNTPMNISGIRKSDEWKRLYKTSHGKIADGLVIPPKISGVQK
jgi:hypothetical protein